MNTSMRENDQGVFLRWVYVNRHKNIGPELHRISGSKGSWVFFFPERRAGHIYLVNAGYIPYFVIPENIISQFLNGIQLMVKVLKVFVELILYLLG